MGGVISKVNRVLNAKSTGIFMFGFTGTYKIFTDYKRAPESEKKNVLLKDTFILAGSATGLAAYSVGRNNFIASPLRKNSSKLIDKGVEKFKKTRVWHAMNTSIGKVIEKPLELIAKHSYNIAKDCLDNTLLVASGIMGALGMDYLIQVGHSHRNIVEEKTEQEKVKVKETPVNIVEDKMMHTPVAKIKKSHNILKHKKKVEDTKITQTPANTYVDPVTKLKSKFKDNVVSQDINNIVNEDTKNNIISNITNMPEMKVFTNTMIGLQSLRITEEKTFKDKLRSTTNSLLKGTLVPMFFLSLTSNITKGMRSIYRVPIVFTSLVAGTMITNKKIDKKMSKING